MKPGFVSSQLSSLPLAKLGFTPVVTTYDPYRPCTQIFIRRDLAKLRRNSQPPQGLATLVAYSLGVIESKITDCYRRRCWDNCKRRIKQLWETYLSPKESLVHHSTALSDRFQKRRGSNKFCSSQSMLSLVYAARLSTIEGETICAKNKHPMYNMLERPRCVINRSQHVALGIFRVWYLARS